MLFGKKKEKYYEEIEDKDETLDYENDAPEEITVEAKHLTPQEFQVPAEEPAPRFTPSYQTVLGSGVKFEGNIVANEPIVINGEFTGNIISSTDIIITETGSYSGEAVTKSMIVSGRLDGNIKIEDTITLNASSLVTGSIAAVNFVTEKGAIFDGELKLVKPNTKFDPPVAAPVTGKIFREEKTVYAAPVKEPLPAFATEKPVKEIEFERQEEPGIEEPAFEEPVFEESAAEEPSFDAPSFEKPVEKETVIKKAAAKKVVDERTAAFDELAPSTAPSYQPKASEEIPAPAPKKPRSKSIYDDLAPASAPAFGIKNFDENMFKGTTPEDTTPRKKVPDGTFIGFKAPAEKLDTSFEAPAEKPVPNEFGLLPQEGDIEVTEDDLFG